MAKTALVNKPTARKAYIVTGPTSGIGRSTALELAKHGTVILVGRDRGRLDEMQKIVEQEGRHAVSVVCDLSDPASVRRAATEIVAQHLPIVGFLNNAGIMQRRVPYSCSRRREAISDRCPTTDCSPRFAAWGTSRGRSPFTDSDRRLRRCSMSKDGIAMPSSGSWRTGSATRCVRPTTTPSIYLSGGA
jgi:NAD(P)-dependent dehydrogenase (short-subunit alcohol dehydrogenase family)